ncbi:MAG: hypothetical protein KDB40_16350 [Acidimicrobiales bacterium]|nr:hypothetical protein [Acidimicrobiales bacterium]MCB9395579.1 citrate transporter [Acidimicrobiaceae bacterium]
MSVVALVLLIVASLTMLVRPRGAPVWAGPLAAAVVGLATGAIPLELARSSASSLRDPLLFVAVAVPLAVALDRLGVFEALAALVDGGRHLPMALWWFGAAVTAVFNLDAAVVLLTPLYARIARRHSLPLEPLVFQPAMLACIASSPLPVSNLTNLIVAEGRGLGVGDFVGHLLVPTLLAVAVGWLGLRRVLPVVLVERTLDLAPDRRALSRGLPVVAFVLVGFTAGDVIGIPAWAVAAIALAAAVALGAPRPPLVALPWEAVLVALALGVVVAGATPHLGLESLLDGSGVAGRAQALLAGVIGANVTNNLPAVLATAPALGSSDQVWPLLIGVNIGPALVLTGALSSLLWRDTAAAAGVHVAAARFSAVGVRVGLPALAVAGAWVVLVP